MTHLEERVERQFEIDDLIKFTGGLKHDKNSLRLSKSEGYGETEAGKRFSNMAVKGFVEKFDEYVHRQINLPTTRSIVMKHLIDKREEDEMSYRIDPYQLGRMVVRAMLRSLVKPEDKRITVTGVAFDLGEAVEYSIKEVLLDIHHADQKFKLLDMLRRQEKLGDKEVISREINKLAERVKLDHTTWSKADHGAVGQALLSLFYRSKVYKKGLEDLVFGDLFVEHDEQTFKNGSRKTKKTVDISDVGLEWLRENEDFIKSITLSYLPMVIPPRDWTIDHGGYVDQGIYDTYTLIKGYSRSKIKNLYDVYPYGFDKLMGTINILQKTPFRINETVWDAVMWVNEYSINLERKGVPNYNKSWPHILGGEKADEFFEIQRQLTKENNRLDEDSKNLLLDFVRTVIEGSSSMSEKDLWKAWSNIRREVVKCARAEKSKRILINNTLLDSGEFRGEDIYFCYNADYRGRIYPLSGQFSPQGSDTSRGMLEFANGVEVDPEEDADAVRNIAIIIANNFGEDKISLDERELWTFFNTDDILACAENFKENKWWMKADKPFLFLQGCLEWKKHIDAIENGEKFISTMPISFDGSCNGIQHYSALFLDPKGAKAVNLVKGELPSDVYKEVAEEALHIAKGSKGKYEKLISSLNEKLDGKLFGRKVAKRSVMTLPYGVSKRSSNVYVHEEVNNITKKSRLTEKQAKCVRSKMGNLIWDAILVVVEKPVTGKEYFQSVAKEMADWEKGLMWFTPTGLPVLQNLKKRDIIPNKIRVTIDGKTVVRKYPKYTNEIDSGEQANAVAPNFVHSFDSSHLQLSVTAAFEEGMKNFLVIHDSFSTDAISAGRFNHIIREQFVEMYRDSDWVNRFHDDCEEQLGFELSTPRERQGDFDIEQVLESEYFFS